MKKLLLGALVALLPLTGFSATVLGIHAGAGSWKHDPSGSITSSVGGTGTSADLKMIFNYQKKAKDMPILLSNILFQQFPTSNM